MKKGIPAPGGGEKWYSRTVESILILILNQQLEINETLWYNKKG
jgi:hypothetical protein